MQDRHHSVCKKCARNIVNCYKLFTELRQPFVVGLAREKLEEISNTSPQSPERDRCRVLAHVQHQRSPTGMTPTAKHPKGREILACDKEEGS